MFSRNVFSKTKQQKKPKEKENKTIIRKKGNAHNKTYPNTKPNRKCF